jgi:hypothetical protein
LPARYFLIVIGKLLMVTEETQKNQLTTNHWPLTTYAVILLSTPLRKHKIGTVLD